MLKYLVDKLRENLKGFRLQPEWKERWSYEKEFGPVAFERN